MTRHDWDRLAAEPHPLPEGWRRHACRAHLELVGRWLGEVSGTWLKTDLQEELEPARTLLPHLGGTWLGIDVSGEVVRRSRHRGSVADVRRLPFRSGAFDGVLSTSTLDHFESLRDIERSVVELRRVVRQHGRLVLTRLARWRWWERHALDRFDRLGATRLAPRTGHYVAILASAV